MDFLRALERKIEEYIVSEYGYVLWLGDWKPLDGTLIDTRCFRHKDSRYETYAFISGQQLGFGITRSNDYINAVSYTFDVCETDMYIREAFEKVVG